MSLTVNGGGSVGTPCSICKVFILKLCEVVSFYGIYTFKKFQQLFAAFTVFYQGSIIAYMWCI